jgi:hypothetical protein
VKRGDLVKTVPGWCTPQRIGLVIGEEASGEWFKIRWAVGDLDAWQPIRKLELAQ